MSGIFDRTELLIGEAALNRLKRAKIAVFGIGGVGGYVCEALVRSGVGAFELVDKDTVSATNINRQIIALHSTVGRDKTEVMKERMLDINPEVQVSVRNCFFLPENSSEFDFTEYDYVVDAVDTVTAKLEIIKKCKEAGVPVISSMGTGNKLDPSRLMAADIFKTDVCPLAKVMRKELRKLGIDSLKTVYSDEKPVDTTQNADPEIAPVPDGDRRRSVPGSTSFVPSSAGLLIASEVVKDIISAPAYPKRCECCRKAFIEEPYSICPVCGWEDDKVQNRDPEFAGGANKDSLNQHRHDFERDRTNE